MENHQKVRRLSLVYFEFSHILITQFCSFKIRRYPASLSVTVGPYKPELQQSISISRPMSVLEEEITGDIYTRSSDDDDNERTELIHDTSAELNEVKQSKSMGSNSNRNDFKAMNLESRLPGQVNTVNKTSLLCGMIMYFHFLAGM